MAHFLKKMFRDHFKPFILDHFCENILPPKYKCRNKHFIIPSLFFLISIF